MTPCLLLLVATLFYHLSSLCESQQLCQNSDCGSYPCRGAQVNDRCYYIVYESTTFAKARQVCRDMGMSLVTSQNGSVPSDVTYGLLTVMGAWLQGTARLLPQWAFVNGNPIQMTGRDSSQCGVTYSRYNWRGSGKIDYFFKPMSCFDNTKFLCRKDNCEPLTRDCILHDPEQQLTWFEARDYCKQRHADLFYLLPEETVDEMSRVFIWAYHNKGNYFVGLRKRVWVWIEDTENGEKDTEMDSMMWTAGEPNRDYKNCIKLVNSGSWEDQECSRSGPFPLCIRDATLRYVPTQTDDWDYDDVNDKDDVLVDKTTTLLIRPPDRITTALFKTSTARTELSTREFTTTAKKELTTQKITTTAKKELTTREFSTEGTVISTLPPLVNYPTTTVIQYTNPTTIPKEQVIKATAIPDYSSTLEKESTTMKYLESTTLLEKSADKKETHPNDIEEVLENVATSTTSKSTIVSTMSTRLTVTTPTTPSVKVTNSSYSPVETDLDTLKTLTKLVFYMASSSSFPISNILLTCLPILLLAKDLII